jgi:hypothetical protein
MLFRGTWRIKTTNLLLGVYHVDAMLFFVAIVVVVVVVVV